VAFDLVLIPTGEFVLGDAGGRPNERPATRVRIERPFYLGRTEVTNAQYAAVARDAHDSGFVSWMSIDWRGEGHPLNRPDQPAVRVSWHEAMQFCQELAARTGKRVTLPSEAQWEWACRAGTAASAWYGGPDEDFAGSENLAGRELRSLAFGGKPKWYLRDDRFQDTWAVTAPAGSTRPNPWGLCDMLGNVREWTRSTYRPYPYVPETDVLSADAADEKTVRGGSWASRPCDAGSAWRWKYPTWRKVHDVGFRIAVKVD
jgi:formylglycine-generating enzyme required for sulfatase activity